MGVTAQWLKFSLNKFRERFQIREIREIKGPWNISTIRYSFYQNNNDFVKNISLHNCLTKGCEMACETTDFSLHSSYYSMLSTNVIGVGKVGARGANGPHNI